MKLRCLIGWLCNGHGYQRTVVLVLDLLIMLGIWENGDSGVCSNDALDIRLQGVSAEGSHDSFTHIEVQPPGLTVSLLCCLVSHTGPHSRPIAYTESRDSTKCSIHERGTGARKSKRDIAPVSMTRHSSCGPTARSQEEMGSRLKETIPRF